jgi:hypothetical protein
MPEFPNPKLAGINDALTQLEPLLEDVGRAHGFRLIRARESYRYLQRDLSVAPVIRHEIGMIISISMEERLERGFFPEIPCTLYVHAHHPEFRKHCHAEILRNQPLNSLRPSLPGHLRDAVATLDTWTADFICEHGIPDRDHPA